MKTERVVITLLFLMIFFLTACISMQDSGKFEEIDRFNVSGTGTIWDIAPHPVDDTLAIAVGGDAYLINTQTGLTNVIINEMGFIQNLVWCDNSLIGSGRQLWIWNSESNDISLNPDNWQDFYYYAPVTPIDNCNGVISIYGTSIPQASYLYMWNFSNNEYQEIDLEQVSPTFVEANRNINQVAILSDNPSEVLIFSLTEERITQELSLPDKEVITLRWSPTGDQLAALTDTSLVIWDTTNWNYFEIDYLRERKLTVALEWHPNSNYLATASDIDVRIWDISTGNYTLVQNEGSSAIAWYHNGDAIITTSEDDLVIWDLEFK